MPADNPRVERREAYLRRAWRLAALLTGDPDRADAVLRRCLARRPDLEHLSIDRLERIVIQETRSDAATAGRPASAKPHTLIARLRDRHERHSRAESRASPPTHAPTRPPRADASDTPAAADVALAALAELPAQQREAWILRALDAENEIDASKAMDCSRTALARHLEHAEDSMRSALGDSYNEVLAALRARVETFDPGPFVSEIADARRRRRLTRIVGAFAILMIILLVTGYVLLRLLGP